MKIEEYAQYKAFRHFLDTGTLLSPDAPCFLIGSSPSSSSSSSLRRAVTDEEYLGGACIGLCHELARYAVQRAATALKDPEAVASVQRARDVINSVLEELLQFDFRNGPLRRKYDGTKYELKTVETILYELSVAGAVGGREGLVASGDVYDASLGQQKKKKMRIEQEDEEETMGNGDVAMEEEETKDGAPEIIPKEGIAAIRKRMDHRDALRERLIKTCRDGQKAAKQAIFGKFHH